MCILFGRLACRCRWLSYRMLICMYARYAYVCWYLFFLSLSLSDLVLFLFTVASFSGLYTRIAVAHRNTNTHSQLFHRDFAFSFSAKNLLCALFTRFRRRCFRAICLTNARDNSPSHITHCTQILDKSLIHIYDFVGSHSLN